MLRWTILAVALVAAAGPASASPEGTPDPRAQRLRRIVDSLPARAGTMAAQTGPASNVMFAQIETPKHEGYASSLLAYKAGPRARTHLAYTFQRTAAEKTQQQSSDFSWRLPRGALSMGSRLKPSSLATRKAMGSNGAISMKLLPGSQYIRGTPQGCTGSIEYRLGVVAGRAAVNFRDQYFRKVGFRSGRVVLYREHDLRCPQLPGTPSCPDDLWLAATDPETGVAIGVFRTDEGRVDQRVAVATKSGDADAVHRISVQVALPEAFDASEDLTSATVDGDVAGPWLSGDLSYLAPPPAADETDDCGPYRSTSGVITGDFTAYFDAVGAVTPATTGLPATLRRQAS